MPKSFVSELREECSEAVDEWVGMLARTEIEVVKLS